MSDEEHQKIVNYRHTNEITLIITIVFMSLSTLLRQNWPTAYSPKIYIVALVASVVIYILLAFHTIPKKWRFTRIAASIDPLVTMSFVFASASLTTGIGGESFYIMVVILIIAGLGLDGDLLIPVGFYLAVLLTFSFFTDRRVSDVFHDHPTTFLSRYIVIIVAVYAGRYLSKEAWSQRQARRKLEELQKVRNEFIFTASHNLRTPITIIRGYLQTLLKDEKKYPKEKREAITHINAATEKLQSLSEDLLEIASLEGHSVLILKQVDIEKVVRDLILEVSPQASRKGIAISTEIEKDLPKLNADEKRIRELVKHLLQNAVKFNKKGGEVLLKASIEEKSLKISVKDTGIGISKEEQSKIFNKFYRVGTNLEYNYEGEGLGLYIVKTVVELHGGKIWVDSTPGIGSTFTFTIPLTADK